MAPATSPTGERCQHVQGSRDVDVDGLDEPCALELGRDRGDRAAVNSPGTPDVPDQDGDRGIDRSRRPADSSRCLTGSREIGAGEDPVA